ncbi:MAG: glycosyltransferase family 39 protein [Arenicellales bacterium]
MYEKKISNFGFRFVNQQTLLAGLVVLWASMQIFLYLTGGIRPAGDSGRYLGAAEVLLSGHLPTSGKAMSYLAYDGIVAIITGLGWGQVGVVFVQILMSGIAAYILYLLGTYLYDWRAGFVAAFLYAGFPDLQKWNFYILTESLFITTLVLTSYVILARKGWQRVIFGGLLVLLATFLRPNGFIVPLSLLLYVLVCLWQDGKRPLVGGIIVFTVVVLSVASVWVGGMLSKEHVLNHYIEGTVIWGHPESALIMPGQIADCTIAKGNALYEIACFAVAKPLFFIKLVAMKLFYFFLLARPYYSVPHNVLILLFLLPVYTLTIISLIQGRKEFVRWGFAAIIIFLQAMVVSFTFADWDSRHLEVVLPLIFLFASGGAVWLLDVVQNNKFNRLGAP